MPAHADRQDTSRPMPSEIRRLIFTTEEVEQALREAGRVGSIAMPPGKIIDLDLVEGGDRGYGEETSDTVAEGMLSITLEEGPDGDTVSNAVFRSTQIAAALLLMCLRQRIPMPRNATKRLRLVNGELTLDLIVPARQAAAPAAVPAARG